MSVEVNLVVEATKFMALGMGTVFVFLVLMIIIMNVQGNFFQKYFPDKPNTDDTPKRASSAPKKSNKVAAMFAAILHHNQYKAQ